MRPKNYDPFSNLSEQFRRFTEHIQSMSRFPFGFSPAPWTPAINICETDGSYIIHVELPGVDPGNLLVTVHDDLLMVQGERKPAAIGVSPSRCLHMEIAAGTFTRTVRMPQPVDAENVQAHYERGILEVILPKSRQENSGERIQIIIKD